MATESGSASAPLNPMKFEADDQPDFRRFRRLLDEEPFRVQFFQAVRMLQRMDGERRPIGHFGPPEGETIRFRALPSLAFPPSELYSIVTEENGQRTMTVQFMGFCASVSVLPAAYTELVLQRKRQKDHALGEFFDLFNHRMISFFYRGWEKYRFYIGYENRAEDRISPRLMDMLGLGTPGLRGRAGVEDEALLNYAALLGRHVRSASSLRQVLEDYFGVRVQVHQFAGTWRKLQLSDRTRFLGVDCASERLGVGVVSGDEVWDHHGRIRVSLGPLKFADYLNFLPGQSAYRELCAWLRFYSNRAYESEVQLILERRDAPSCELGADGAAQPQLGFVSWLKTMPLVEDPREATYLII